MADILLAIIAACATPVALFALFADAFRDPPGVRVRADIRNARTRNHSKSPTDRTYAATGSPYRREHGPPRFSLTVNGEVFEGDCFNEVVRVLRSRGHGEGALVLAALAMTTCPRGAILEVTSG